MTRTKLVLYLDNETAGALADLAQANLRTPPQQALWILHEAARGLLAGDPHDDDMPAGEPAPVEATPCQ